MTRPKMYTWTGANRRGIPRDDEVLRGDAQPEDSPGVFRTWGGCWGAVGCSIIMWVVIIWIAREILDWIVP